MTAAWKTAGAILMVLAVAGCVDTGPSAPAAPPDGLGALRPVFFPAVAVSQEEPGAEPVIAVATDGTIFIEGVGSRAPIAGVGRNTVNKVWRSTDGGQTFQDVTPRPTGEEASFDGFLAVGNRDRVYAVNVFATTFEFFRSDDMGTSWVRLNPPRIPASMHRNWVVPRGDDTVHVVMEALPPSFLVPGFPSNPNEGLWYLKSNNRGASWTMPRQIDPIVNFAGQGNLVVDDKGLFLAVPRYDDAAGTVNPTYQSGRWYLLVSEDGGTTWKRRDMFSLRSELAAAVPSLALDEDGTLYFVWSQERDGTSQLQLSLSKDRGATWSPPRTILPSPSAQAMPWIDARGPGELGAVWYQADQPGSAVTVNANWFAHYALLTAADTIEPVVHEVRVTHDPVHTGNICAKGPACKTGEDRRLLDYPWLDFGPDRRAHFAVASTKWDRPSAFAVYAGEVSALAPPGSLPVS